MGDENVSLRGYLAKPGMFILSILKATSIVSLDFEALTEFSDTYANSLGPILGISGTPKMLTVRPLIFCTVKPLSR